MTFSTLISFYCPDGTFSTLKSFLILPWWNIFYLDIILLPWGNIFLCWYYFTAVEHFSTLIYLFTAVMWRWYHFNTMMEHFLLRYHFYTELGHFLPWYLFAAVMWYFLSWYYFNTVTWHFLLWYHFTTMINIQTHVTALALVVLFLAWTIVAWQQALFFEPTKGLIFAKIYFQISNFCSINFVFYFSYCSQAFFPRNIQWKTIFLILN